MQYFIYVYEQYKFVIYHSLHSFFVVNIIYNAYLSVLAVTTLPLCVTYTWSEAFAPTTANQPLSSRNYAARNKW